MNTIVSVFKDNIFLRAVPALLIVTALFAAGWTVKGWSDAEETKQQELAIAEKRLAIEKMSKELILQLKTTLDEIEKQGVKERLVIQKEVEKPTYKQQCFDQSGVGIVNEMAKGGNKK